ncbi:MAG: RNA-binding protein [candidate division Zixibacteria bacterium]|nr:RNA-binding protein [candidate division Zixibacteria bacterium]
MNIYVGNLPFEINEDELRTAFEEFGEVSSAKVITDRYSGKPRGFAFVEMPDDGQAQSAISELNDRDMKGRALKVSQARPREDRGPRGGGGGRGRY